jgi:hypothetical protein
MANRYALKYWMRSTPRGLSAPIEISHYRDGSANSAGYATGVYVTKQGLLDYGRGLGEALLWQLTLP